MAGLSTDVDTGATAMEVANLSRTLGAVTQSVDSSSKDAILNQLADVANVAQFVSCAPGETPQIRFSRIRGHQGFGKSDSVYTAIQQLLAASPEGRINIRSFRRGEIRNQEFLYGLSSAEDALANLRRLARSGLYTILNETIDVADGGVSGVSYGGVLEFAPEDTPRCVEKPGTASLPKELGVAILKTVYGFLPEIEFGSSRVEFSIHPKRRGWRNSHTVIWELESDVSAHLKRPISWPNRFSEFLGDKVYGLLVANALGFQVPWSKVICRTVAPFEFGRNTGTGEVWLRTCPRQQVPGKYPTYHGWRDPFRVLADFDSRHDAIQAVIAQAGVDAEWSGALITGARGEPLIEGVRGSGEEFMQGQRGPEALPNQVLREIHNIFRRLTTELGAVRIEWVYDGSEVWILQLHVGSSPSEAQEIVPGEPERWHVFKVKQGLEALRQQIEGTIWGKQGIILEGDVGITSHFADILRRKQIPSRIVPDRDDKSS